MQRRHIRRSRKYAYKEPNVPLWAVRERPHKARRETRVDYFRLDRRGPAPAAQPRQRVAAARMVRQAAGPGPPALHPAAGAQPTTCTLLIPLFVTRGHDGIVRVKAQT